ncbi:MAG: FAD-binding protein [Bilophila wadsworthia]
MGAVAAIKKGCTVILADKAWVGSRGESTFAAGDILYYDPEQDDMLEWLERWNKAGDSMFDPEWLEWYGKNVHELILMLDSWGMEFEKDAQGRFKRSRTRPPRSRGLPGYKMQKKLRGILESSAWSSSTA